MKHIVNVPYADWREIIAWCKDYLPGPIWAPSEGGITGSNWRVYNTTLSMHPYVLITRGEFDDPALATMFALRWS